MTNPVLVELTRGTLVESVHRGAVAIADANGAIRFALGDIETPHYPRSSLKPIQALPLVETGAADALGLTDEHIALACASHSGEPMHTERVAAWLSRLGERPTRIHNNCSGKHTGFLTVARHWEVATKGYEDAYHPVQQAVAAALRELSGEKAFAIGVDGCAAPNFALPLAGFARALAKLASPKGLAADRARAAKRVVGAMVAHPELVSGTGRVCAILMRAAEGRAAVKAGAEGFYAGIVPSLGLGIAVKIDDGAARAAETVIACVVERLGLLSDDAAARAIVRGPVTNTRGDVVGERRPAEILNKIALS
jgi:L-asparaginase II